MTISTGWDKGCIATESCCCDNMHYTLQDTRSYVFVQSGTTSREWECTRNTTQKSENRQSSILLSERQDTIEVQDSTVVGLLH
jgi:hypothetical protein